MKIYKAISIAILSVLTIVGILFLYLCLFGPEQYFIFDPYIDTEMAEGFSPEKFQEVSVTMSKTEVLNLLGQPLDIHPDFINDTLTYYSYTNDGKILDKEMPWYMFNDYAWYNAQILFRNDTVVEIRGGGWVYD